MHTSVRRDQFDTRGNMIVHTPTGAEFTANPSSRDSFLIWTGELDRNLPNGDSYSYADVLAMMKTSLARRRFRIRRSPAIS